MLNYNILIVDDDQENLNHLRTHLEKEGYAVQTVETGASALEAVSTAAFEILICDYNIPDINGLELIQKILDISSSIVPLLITSVRSMDIVMEGMRIGVHDYLVKPIDYTELSEALSTIIQEKEKYKKGQEWLRENTLKKDETEISSVPSSGPLNKEIHSLRDLPPLSENSVHKSPEATPAPPKTPTPPQVSDSVGTPIPPPEDMPPVTEKKKKFLWKIPALIGAAALILAIFLLRSSSDTPGFIIDTLPTSAIVEVTPEISVESLSTPFRLPSDLTPGLYTFRLGKEGYSTYERVINIPAEYNINDLAALFDADISTDHEGTDSVIILLERFIQVDSYPSGAEVYIGGVFRSSTTPFSSSVLSGKLLDFVFKKEGYNTLGEDVGEALIRADDLSSSRIDSLFWTLRDETDKLYIEGRLWDAVEISILPEGASLYSDGNPLEMYEGILRLPLGENELRATYPGFTGWSGSLNVPYDEELSIHLEREVMIRAYDESSPDTSVAAGISINGRRIEGEKTPLFAPLRAGENRLTFSAAPNFESRTITYYLDADDSDPEVTAALSRVRLIRVTLEVLTPPGDTPVKGAVISAAGRRLGVTDSSGRLFLQLSDSQRSIRADYNDRSASSEITPDSDGRTVRLRLPPPDPVASDGVIILDSRPHFPGAAFRLNGETYGDTLRRITNLKPGDYLLEISHQELGEISHEIRLSESGRVIINLKPGGEIIER